MTRRLPAAVPSAVRTPATIGIRRAPVIQPTGGTAASFRHMALRA